MANIRNKHRYRFLSRPNEKPQTKEEERNLRQEIRLYLEDLKKHHINLSRLGSTTTTVEQRNRLLNISLGLIKDAQIMEKLISNNNVDSYSISRACGLSIKTIERYKSYIIAYMLLFSSDSYSNLRLSMDIGTDFDITTEKFKNNTLIRGIKLNDSPMSTMILSRQGEFAFIDTVASKSSQGEEVSGVLSIFKPNRVKYFTAVSLALIIIFSFIAVKYYSESKTLHIVSGAHVTMSYNRLDRLISEEGLDGYGKDIIKKTAFSDKKVPSTIAEVMETGAKNQYFTKQEPVTVNITSGTFKKSDFDNEELLKVIRRYEITVKVNMNDGNFFILK